VSERASRAGGRLPSATAATRYQRQWFADLQAQAAAGVPVALVNADAPQEVFRAMGIPYVVNQWWASIVSAKQQTQGHLALLRERSYPDYTEQYSSLSLASSFHPDPATAPWGGLPRPSIVLGETTGDVNRKLFDVWHEQPGTSYFPLESAAQDPVEEGWWELMPHEWERAIGVERIDLMHEELIGLVRSLELMTGREFSESRFREVMALVNEQEEWNRRTRDLIATARPCPVAVTDIVPSVMVPQWHRGTEWGRDAARTLHDEVRERVEAGVGVCADERARLMWVGRGLWFDLDFYRDFEERYGAVFVWSMYTDFPADGYRRYFDDDPFRALAARRLTVNEQLRLPGWMNDYVVKKARDFRIDGAALLISEGDRSQATAANFSQLALERAGIPVHVLKANTVDERLWDAEAQHRAMERFVEDRLLSR